MYSDGDTPKGWVAPFGYPRIKACSRLPMAFRSVPRPSSPPGAKASTECPSLAQDHEPTTEIIGSLIMYRSQKQQYLTTYCPTPDTISSKLSNTCGAARHH